MPINYIPNDPLAVQSVPMRVVAPLPNRPAGRAGFAFSGAVAPNRFPPGTPEFLFLQCRQAALTAVDVWEQLSGALTNWSSKATNPKSLNLIQDGGAVLNAFYDRDSLSFFHHTTGAKTTFSGASTDVVAHEAGHAFLDALRPDLFDSNVTEHGAFHEAFGDCMAILVALFDRATRTVLLSASPNLGQANFVEGTAEDLSDGVKRALGANHPASKPRRALNQFQFALPTTLPTNAPPDVLTSEIHSFGRVFSGCFYDTIRNSFNAPGALKTEAGLLRAARIAGELLVIGAKQAPLAVRFFQAVGRAMVLADDAKNGGVNRDAIGRAFAGHSVQLGSASLLLPKASLAGKAPVLLARAARLSRATLEDLRGRLRTPARAQFAVAPITLGATRMVELVHQRAVSLSGLSSKLKGVVAMAPEAVVVGASHGVAAMMSALPDETTTQDEVAKFVQTLLAHGRIEIGKAKKPKAKAAAIAAGPPAPVTTHRVIKRGGQKTLERVRYTCGCHTAFRSR